MPVTAEVTAGRSWPETVINNNSRTLNQPGKKGGIIGDLSARAANSPICVCAVYNARLFHPASPLGVRFIESRDTIIFRLHTANIPPLFFLAIGLLVGLLSCAAVLRTVERAQEQVLIADYGQSLANLAAKRAVDATLNHDLVSLQVVLQDVVENPRTLLASIHDVENNLLVQAGSTQALTHAAALRSFSAPIPLQDSIAGFVTVNIESQMPEIKALYLSFAAVCSLLVIVALLSLFNRPGPLISIEHKAKEKPAAKPGSASSEPTPALDEPAQAPAPVYTAYLRWQWHNLATLRQQISAERLEQLFNRLELILVEAVKITGIQCQTRRNQGRQNGEYWLTYSSGESILVAYYQLMVCAHLIHQLVQEEKLKLVVSSTLSSSDQHSSVPSAQLSSGQIVCLLPEGIDEEWDDWIYYNEVPNGLQLMGFVPPLDDDIGELLTGLRTAVAARST